MLFRVRMVMAASVSNWFARVKAPAPMFLMR